MSSTIPQLIFFKSRYQISCLLSNRFYTDFFITVAHQVFGLRHKLVHAISRIESLLRPIKRYPKEYNQTSYIHMSIIQDKRFTKLKEMHKLQSAYFSYYTFIHVQSVYLVFYTCIKCIFYVSYMHIYIVLVFQMIFLGRRCT